MWRKTGIPEDQTKDKGGRPAGKWLSDLELKKALLAHTTETCRVSQRTREPIRTLNSTLSKIHALTPELHCTYAYSTLAQRVARLKLGVAKGKKRTDVCSHCAHWDNYMSKQVESLYAQCERQLKGLDPQYFLEWQAVVEGNQWDKDGFVRAESPSYMAAFVKYVNSAADSTTASRIARRGTLPDEVRFLLPEVEAILCRKFEEQELEQCVSDWNFHWNLRDFLADAYHKSREEWNPNEVWLQWDYQEP